VDRNLDVTESGEWAEIWMLLRVVSGQKLDVTEGGEWEEFGCY
jgi:hypothetical protein